jgi:type IV pilus assembly protein PilW
VSTTGVTLHALIRRAHGFTILELLISLAIGLLILAGLGSVLFHTTTIRRFVATQTDLQDRGRYALATIEPDLEMAGYYGLATAASRAMAATGKPFTPPCGRELVTGLTSQIKIGKDALATSCPAVRGRRLTGSDSITIWRLSGHLTTPEPGRIQVLTSTLPIITTTAFTDGTLPKGISLTPQQVELRDLLVRTYYIASGSDGDSQMPSLRVKGLTAIGGAPAFVDTEVIPGVENMRIRALPSDQAPRSIEITLTIRSLFEPISRPQRIAPLRVVRHIALRNEA